MTGLGRSVRADVAGATKRRFERRAVRFLVGLAALTVLLASPARGQESGGPGGDAPVEASADPTAERSPAQPAAPAGEPFVAPRSGRAYNHVFLAFGIAWALMLGFIVVLGRRFAAVERDLLRLHSRDG